MANKTTMQKPSKIQNTAMRAEKRCLLEQQMIDMAGTHRIKFVRVVEVEADGFLLEATYYKHAAPYYLATARDPYEPRVFTRVHTAIQKAQELFAVSEVIVRLQN